MAFLYTPLEYRIERRALFVSSSFPPSIGLVPISLSVNYVPPDTILVQGRCVNSKLDMDYVIYNKRIKYLHWLQHNKKHKMVAIIAVKVFRSSKQ